MKFNHSLQFNAVPEWISKYMDYSALKKLIYTLEKQQVGSDATPSGTTDVEHQALMEPDNDAADGIFSRAINKELKKVDEFYRHNEAKVIDDLEVFLADEAEYNKRHVVETGTAASSSSDQYRNGSSNVAVGGVGSTPYRFRDFGGSANGNTAVPRPRSSSEGNIGGFNIRGASDISSLDDYKITLKKRAIQVYVSLSELRSYAQLNRTGFTKALKKYRKTLGSELRESALGIDKAYIFAANTDENLEDRINECVAAFARLATDNNTRQAAQQLRMHLREHVVWERNTVWRDMIGMERRNYAAIAGGIPDDPKQESLDGRTGSSAAGGLGGSVGGGSTAMVRLFGRVYIPIGVLSSTSFKILTIFILFMLLLIFPPLESTAQSHCLAVVVTASLLWATEAMPLFVTSLMVPFLVVVLRIPVDDATNKRMSAEEASHFIFSAMWSSVIMLLLGGFTLAAALSKYEIAKRLATAILARSGTNPRIILLNLMFVAAFLSMWISNVAAPVLCYSIAQPLLRTLSDGSPFARAIVFGIALASNVGGMVSPIASPQNIIALENMSPPPSWAQWFVVAIPVSIISIVLIWIMLIFTFRADAQSQATAHIRDVENKFTATQWFICGVSVVTIVLWVLSRQLTPVVGEMGVIALIPIVLFFGTGLLTSADFNNFLWTIIALAMGGIALGKAVSSSGLLNTVASHIVGNVSHMPLYGVYLSFGIMILIVATFVSHTVAALIILPLVASIGEDLPSPRPNLLVMASALLCSGAMGLPTSGFPNVTAICMTDGLGKPYLTVGTFIKRGVLASVLVYLVVATVGYVMMNIAGF